MTPATARITLLAFFATVVLLNLPACGSNIPIGEAPTCTDLVTDECVPEVVEEFCSTPSTPEDLLTLHVEQYERGFLDGITRGAEACEETREASFEALCKRLPYGIRKKQPECREYCR